MKKLLLQVWVVLIALSMYSTVAHGQGIPILYEYGGEKIVKIASFPDTESFQNTEGYYFDAGIIYKQVKVFFLPLWNYDVRWCGYIDETTFIELDTVELSEYARVAGVQLPTAPPVPLWDQLGGKLILIGVLIGVGMYLREYVKTEPTES